MDVKRYYCALITPIVHSAESRAAQYVRAEVFDRVTAELDTLRAQLAERDALLREAACHATRMEPMSASCLNRIDDALSASAEPGAPKVWRYSFDEVKGSMVADPYGDWIYSEPSAPVERDERAALESYFAKVGLPLDLLPTGEYLIPATRFVAQGWHARSALERKS